MVAHTCNLSTQEAKAGEDQEFKAILSYTVRPCLKKTTTKPQTTNEQNNME
jgi:hypothetical protein